MSIVTTLGIVSLLLTSQNIVEAQSAPQITSINLDTVASTSATITFTVNPGAGGRIVYDTVAHNQVSQYQFDQPVGGVYTADAPSHTITLPNLTASTTYHYRIEVKNANGTTPSADRTFTTQSAAGGGSQLVIISPVADCVDISCSIEFSTNLEAQVEIRWGTVSGVYPPANVVSESNPASGLRTLQITGLNPGTIYFYQMTANGTGGGIFTTGELQFQTSNNPFDHIFTTGQCSDGTALNSCSAGGQFCTPGGTLVSDCSLCGFNCPTGQTCNVAGMCIPDPVLTGSPYQCNNTDCYEDSGVFKAHAPAGCYASWPRCNANTILKVKKDRGCNLWLTCSTSIQSEPSAAGPAENLCLTLAACNSLSIQGQCNKYLAAGQCSNNPVRFCASNADCEAGGSCIYPDPTALTASLQDLTFQTPAQVEAIADLSGNVIAGLDWIQQGGATVIQGNLPWQLMRQIGGEAKIENGDLEQNPPRILPWEPAPPLGPGTTSLKNDFENHDPSSGPNHVLFVQPDPAIPYSGAVSKTFTANPNEFYYAEVRIRSDTAQQIRLQFGFNGYYHFQTPDGTDTFVDILTTTAWQRVTLGPIKFMTGETRVGIACAGTSVCGNFEVDDLQVRPILQVNSNPDYVTPACRLYPKSDALSCEYQDENGVKYKGWRGYCLEYDSQTGTCLSWWPVDIIKGQSNIFGAEKEAGYADRAPLYMCLESEGTYGDQIVDTGYLSSEISYHNHIDGCSDTYEETCQYIRDQGYQYTICTCDDFARSLSTWDAGPTKGIREADILEVVFSDIRRPCVGFFCFPFLNSFSAVVKNNPGFCGGIGLTSCTSPAFTGFNWLYERLPDGAGIMWKVSVSPYPGDNQGADYLEYRLHFDSDGRLARYSATMNDQTGGGQGKVQARAARIVFHTKESCNKIVEVVTPSNENQAYAQRVSLESNFRVNDLLYGRSTDLTPFGGMLGTNQDPTNPAKWPRLSAETPRLNLGQNGQARSGTPYACKGDCNGFSCQTNVYNQDALKNKCSTQAEITACNQLDSDGDGEADGFCYGINFPSGPGLATKRGSQLFEAHDFTQADPANVADNPYFSQERIRRMFAKSYGVWEWKMEGGGAVYDQYAIQSITRLNIITWRATVRCSTTQKYQSDASGSCQPTVCSATTDRTAIGFTAQQAVDRAFALCRGAMACQNDPACITPPGYYAVPGGWPPPAEICAGVNRAREAYPRDFCAVPPRIFCPNADFCDPSDGDGYTGLAQFATGSANKATVTGGSGAVSIKFNTDADPEQVPLQTIGIDWGDGTQDQIDFGYAPRNDPASPHIWSHVYISNIARTFPIKIQVKDNWGWCNNAKKVGLQNDLDNIDDDPGCAAPVADWQDTGLSVRVQP